MFRQYHNALKQNAKRITKQLAHHVVEIRSIQVIMDCNFASRWIFKDLNAYISELFHSMGLSELFGLINLDGAQDYNIQLNPLRVNRSIVSMLIKEILTLDSKRVTRSRKTTLLQAIEQALKNQLKVSEQVI